MSTEEFDLEDLESNDGGPDDEDTIEALKILESEFPASVGECIDFMYALRERRLMLNRRVKLIKSAERAFELHIIKKLKEVELVMGSGAKASASYKPLKKPNPKNWQAIWAFIFETKATDLVAKKLSEKAVQERLDQEIIVPGIEMFDVEKMSLTKRSK